MKSSSKTSWPVVLVKLGSALFCALPLRISIAFAGMMGVIGFWCMSKKRAVVYGNLKTSLGGIKSHSQLKSITRGVFINFSKSFVELLCLPKIKRMGYEHYVDLQGREWIDKGIAKGRGVIFLAIHAGSWEMGSMVGSMTGYTYNIVANEQDKAPELNELLNDFRRIAGAKVIYPGLTTKEIIAALHRNEIISLVLDQGGRDGVPVDFFGKTASMSTGAIRLGLKYDCAVCPVWITRGAKHKHVLKVFPPLEFHRTEDTEKDIKTNTQNVVGFFEGLLKEHPDEYMWFYKVFKYSTQADIVILDDGRTGHLRQSQAIARSLGQNLKKKGKQSREHVLSVEFRSPFLAKAFSLYCWLSQGLRFLATESCLKLFCSDQTFNRLMTVKADYIISCGSKTGGLNFILSQSQKAKSIHILKSGLLSDAAFDLSVLPLHDMKSNSSLKRCVFTRVAPNLINSAYLNVQSKLLLEHFSHLKESVRIKFGVLIGGDTQGVKFEESKIRQLILQIKEAAQHYNADILVTTSRRTPPEIDQLVLKELKNFDRCQLCIVANQNNIPEAMGGILGLCDVLIVSGESISMVSEALSSGRKTIVFSANGDYSSTPKNKYDRFVIQLADEGYVVATSIKDFKSNLSRVLSQKLSFKSLDDQQRISEAMEAFV